MERKERRLFGQEGGRFEARPGGREERERRETEGPRIGRTGG